jgi:hypothetical protein
MERSQIMAHPEEHPQFVNIAMRQANKYGFSLEDVPSIEELEEMMSDCYCDTPDGCAVEPDGHCPHGQPSWLIIMGLI